MYHFGPNAYKNADKKTQWFNDPADPDAMTRFYGNLPVSIPYYYYPVLIRSNDHALVRAADYEEHDLFQVQFNELMSQIKLLAEHHQVKIVYIEALGGNVLGNNFLGVNIINNDDSADNDDDDDDDDIDPDADTIVVDADTPRVNVVDSFADNILCGFNGITTSKFALQSDPQLFADIKEYVEIIVNAMLKDIYNAKGTLERFIAAIAACEGGAWADLKIMALEINPPKGVFAVNEKSREKLANSIASDFVLDFRDFFDDPENTPLETHINVFLQHFFALLDMLKKPAIQDINIPKIKLATAGEYKVVFTNLAEENYAKELLIFLDTLVHFEQKFKDKFQFDWICGNGADHIFEQLNIIYDRYTKIIHEAVRTTGLDPEAYLSNPQLNSHDMITHSLTDARHDCIEQIKYLLNSFDIPNTAYMLVLNDNLKNPNEILKLQSLEMRKYWCLAFAAHSNKLNQVILGFNAQPLLKNSEIAFNLVSSLDNAIQWIETDTGKFVTPYDFYSDTPTMGLPLIYDASTPSFLSGFEIGIVTYGIIMGAEETVKHDQHLVQIGIAALRKDIPSILHMPFLLELRQAHGLPTLLKMAKIEQDSLEAFQLWGKTTVLRLEKKLMEKAQDDPTVKLFKAKIDALNDAMTGTSTEAIYTAIKMFDGTPVSRYWEEAPTASPVYGARSPIGNTKHI